MEDKQATGSVTNAMNNLAGDNRAEAEAHLYHSLCGSLLAVLPRYRSESLTPDVDLSQVINDALHNVLTGIPEGKFPWLKDREDLKKLSFIIAIRLLRQSIRSSKRIKRGGLRRARIDEEMFRELVETDPNDPVEQCIRAESESNFDKLLEKLLNSVREVDERAISIVEMSLSGLTNNQIADELGLRIRRVQQLKEAMENRVLRFLDVE